MKKIIVLILLCITVNVYALPTTYERTLDDLRVHESIKVNNDNTNEILKTPSVDETKKIYDFAELLDDDDDENELYKEVKEFIDTHNMDLVLVTINDNWTYAEKYADNFYDYNYFGIGDTFDGILILIDMDTRELWVSTTGNAILIYNDKRINSILDEMYYYIQDENYYETFYGGISKINHYAEMGIPDDNKNSYIDDNGNYVYVEHKEFPFMMFLGISAIISTIVLVIFIYKNKLIRKAHNAKEYIENDKTKIDVIGDTKISSNTSRVRINTESSSGRSGGSSSHSSSSGRSHGGGGRRF